jgi:hypothetical protein
MRTAVVGVRVRLAAPYGWAVLVLCAAAIHPQPAGAQDRADVALIRDTSPGVPADVANAIDAQLVLDLVDLRGARNVLVSPVTYAEVQLAVGCSDESVACLSAIADTAAAGAVLVRRLVIDASGSIHLRTLYFDRVATRPPAHAATSATLDRRAELVASIPNLLRTLLGRTTHERARQSSSAEVASIPRSAPREAPAVAAATWITLAGGALLLAPGIGLALSAEADYDAFRRQPIETRADADRARRDFGSIETRATWSSVLIPAGAIALGVGAVLLGMDLTAGDEADGDSADGVFLAPLARGAMLGVRGSLDRMH